MKLPAVFTRLLEQAHIGREDIVATGDGFFCLRRSLSQLLATRGILDFPDSAGQILACERFFDDWYLYAVADDGDFVYSLFKLREQEDDARDGAPADGDTPGVTVCFIRFDTGILFDCLQTPTDQNRSALNREINRVVAYGGQRHHRGLKRYFMDPRTQGAYLIASLYVRHIASFARDGVLAVPEHYAHIYQQSISYKKQAKLQRLPGFIRELNRLAGYTLCDQSYLYFRHLPRLTHWEALAILATHTGNVSFHSFAAEVEYHARFLIAPARLKIPFFGKSIYASAIRADMTIDDTEFEGPAPFYRADSRIVRRQQLLHDRQLPLPAAFDNIR